jgi:hypothetical protein
VKTTLRENPDMVGAWSAFHPIHAQEIAAMAALRAIVEPNKGRLQGTPAFPSTTIMKRVARVTLSGISSAISQPIRRAGICARLQARTGASIPGCC